MIYINMFGLSVKIDIKNTIDKANYFVSSEKKNVIKIPQYVI